MTAILLAALMVLVQVATGATWWALVRRRGEVSILELLGMGVALGTFASMLTAVLLVNTPLSGVAWLLPTVVLVPSAFLAWRRGLMADLRVVAPRPQMLAAVLGLAAGLVLIVANSLRIPLDAPSTDSFADLYFFEAISRGLAQFGPAQSILMSGGTLRYHWFAYAWAGDLAQGAGTAPFVVLTRVLPVVTLVGAGALAVAWSGRLSRVRWVPTLAVLLVVVGGYAGALYGSILNFDSPSQAMATVWLLAFGVALVTYVRADIGPFSLLVIAALAAACTGGKVSHALVAAGGAVFVALVGLAGRRQWWRRSLLAVAVAGAAMAVTYVVVLSGVAVTRNVADSLSVKASTWQGLDPVAGRVGVILGTAALLLAVLARVAGLGWLVAVRQSRASPDVLVATGGLLVGIVAMLVLREGVNELWFVLAASAPAAVLSAHGAGVALEGVRHREIGTPLGRPLAWAVVVALPPTVACLVLSRNWGSHQSLLNWLAPVAVWVLVPLTAAIVVVGWARQRSLVTVAALSVAALALVSIGTRPSSLWTASRTITTEAVTVETVDGPALIPSPAAIAAARAPWSDRYRWAAEAAEWLVANTSDASVIAVGDTASALVPALTGRQMFLAGELYQAGLGRTGESRVVAERAYASKAYASSPTPAMARPLCAGGVDFAWLDGRADVAPASAVAYQNDGVTIVRLAGPACG